MARKVAATPSPIKDFLPNLSRRLHRKSSSETQKILGGGVAGFEEPVISDFMKLSAFHTPHPIKNFQSSVPKIEIV